MRRAVGLLVLGVFAAAFAAASARAGGVSTTATTTSTTTTTTTTTTATTTTAPSYAPLALSSLPASCVGAGAAALVPPSHPVIALGTPGTILGASDYSTSSGAVLSFDSSILSGSTCKSAAVTLSSVSLFGGAVTASSVHATEGEGTVAGLEIDGSAVSAATGQTVSVGDWGQLTLGATIGRVTAPLVLRLVQAHDSLAAGTAVAVAFAASAQPVAKPTPKERSQTRQTQATDASRSQAHSVRTHQTEHGRSQPRKPPPDFPESTDLSVVAGGLKGTVQHNPIVSTALQYLGVPYHWGGDNPKTGFDCSGLVEYVFAQLGVSLPHYAAAQYYSPDAVWVAPNRLQAGDLVFFTGSDGTRKAPGHVGIYVGNGYLIDAPHTGLFVQIDSLDEPWFAKNYVGAKKVVASLDARHGLHRPKDAAPAPTVPLMLPLQMTGFTSGISRPWIAAIPTAAHTSATRGYGLWAGITVGGLVLVLLSGTITYRRRRSAPGVHAHA
jgi:cell wall-associated NlpC family hydrolase